MSKKEEPVVNMRTLLIGLGGSGGEVLHMLYGMLTPEQKMLSKCLYMDMDSGDIRRLRKDGIRAERLSSADTVENVAASLGKEDGVYEWLPDDVKKEATFLTSETDNGASQYRYKSRLCMARFLKKPNNALVEILDSMNTPGTEITEKTLRVMIVSSIAGGTGAGTFIQVALYLRKYFRDLGQPRILITGLFGCPDLFSRTARNEQERENMFANAYAAIRELNAMNLAVSGTSQATNDYGKSIRMEIKTKSEGKLFDSRSPEFTGDYTTKPYDNMYFVDRVNAHGAILRSLSQYYKTMADIAYARLFSVMEDEIRTGESNELVSHSKFPTAIYGSAGYGRVVYPYDAILRYLAERKACAELDYKWSYFDNEWRTFCQQEQEAAMESGRFWLPTAADREEFYITTMKNQMEAEGSEFQNLAQMVGLKDGDDRVTAFVTAIEQALTSDDGSKDTVDDGRFSLCNVPAVNEARERVWECDVDVDKNFGGSYRAHLQSTGNSVNAALTSFASELESAISRQASALANTVFPVTADGRSKASKAADELNIYSGLLSLGGQGIHPQATRYLLYRLRQYMRAYVDSQDRSQKCAAVMAEKIRNLNLTFDENKQDKDDVTVARYVSEELKGSKLAFWQESRAKEDLAKYMPSFRKTVGAIVDTANDELKYQVFRRLMQRIDALIGQYEGLFDNLDQYRTKLQTDTERDLMIHNSTDDRCIYVGASPRMKKFYYSGEASVCAALEAASSKACGSAGHSIYEALMDRALAKMQRDKEAARMRREEDEVDAEEDDYSDLGDIFTALVQAYEDYLRENAAYLRTTAIGALINQCCAERGLNQKKIHTDPNTREEFKEAFISKLKDMVAKSAPMLRYSTTNFEQYYEGEEDASKDYVLLGMDPRAKDELQKVYVGEDGKDALNSLADQLGLTDVPVVSGAFSPYELFCFSAVHCLQPTQIYKFNEDFDGSYYLDYCTHLADAMSGGRLSMTGHIDKRWHLRGAMPYISRRLELAWRDDLMKAFTFAMLENIITFTVDSEGRRCFKFNGKFIHFPKGNLVQINNLSRVVEYLAEMELDVPKMAKKLDQAIDHQISLLTGYTGALATYKGGMTKNLMLQELRKNLLEYEADESEGTVAHGKNFRVEKSATASDEECAQALELRRQFNAADAELETEQNLEKTLGGLLEIAWLVHKSEENLGEDRDYGEALLRCGAYILDRFCQNMYGSDWTMQEDTPEYREYVELYNSAVTKMMEEYVVAVARRRKLTPEQLKDAPKRASFLPEGPGDYPGLRVPETIRATREFKWLSEHWRLKPVVRSVE